MSKNSENKKHITRISATSGSNTKVKEPTTEPEVANAAEKTTKKVVLTADKPKKVEKPAKTSPDLAKKSKKVAKTDDGRKPLKEVKLFARPFVALGRYISDSWKELRLVRWPDRKTTWKMTFAVLIYCAIMMIFILLLDTLFTFLFNLVIK